MSIDQVVRMLSTYARYALDRLDAHFLVAIKLLARVMLPLSSTVLYMDLRMYIHCII